MTDLSNLLGLYVGNDLGVTSGSAQRAYQNALAQNQLLMQQAGLANMPQPSNVTPIRPERTPEEIQAQLEARYAEMEAEAERLRIHALTACSVCRWADRAWCKHPLVIGIEQEPTVNVDRHPEGRRNSICGPEKALWEPIPTRWQRFMEWLAKVIERMEGFTPTCHKTQEGVNL